MLGDVGGSSKGDLLREQKETGSEGELSEDVGPAVLGCLGRLGHHPELALGMMNDRHRLAGGRTDGPAATEEVDLLIGVDAAPQMQRQMQIQQAGVRTNDPDGAPRGLRLGAGYVRGQPRGAADGAVLASQFAVQQFLGGSVRGDLLVGQQGEQSVLEGAEAALDFTFGLGTGSDQVRDAQRGECALKLRARIAPIGGGLMAEQSQSIGIEGQRQTVDGEGAAEVLEVVPGGIGGHEGAGEELAGMIIDGEQEGLLVVGRPPLMDRGIVLPELANAGALPATAGLGAGRGRTEQLREVALDVGGHRLTVPVEGEPGGQFVSDELVVGRSLQREEVLQELPHRLWPSGAMAAAGEVEGEGGGMLKPGGTEAEKVSATDAQELGGGVRVEVAAVESVERLVEEAESQAFGELMFFKVALSAQPVRRASLFVSLAALGFLKDWRGGRPLSALAGRRRLSLLLFPQPVSFCSRPNSH